MGQLTLSGSPPIPITLRRSARTRRMTLRVSRLDGRVTLSLPARLAEREALEFAQSREAWLRSALSDVAGPVLVDDGAVLPLAGQEVAVQATGRPRARPMLRDGVLVVRDTRPAAAVAAFLKTMARERLVEASDRYAAQLGRNYQALSLRDTRSRWGSCTSDGRLMYSWRLMMAPPEVLDYVAAHEVAHLAHMDHSPAFWAVVEDMCPDYKTHRRWLRDNGAALHRYIFTD